MHYFLVFLLLIVVLYVFLILSYIKGWFLNFKTNIAFAKKQKTTQILASILVSCRNEQENIENLLNDLTHQNFHGKYEILVINDHSEDKTLDICLAFAKKYNFVHCFSLHEKQGKKHAIELGLKNAKTQFILVTDADCRIGNDWLSEFYDLHQNHNAHLISGLVVLEGSTFFQKLQELEFLSLIASGAGSIGIGKGIMCNGANLAFAKKITENKNSLNTNVISGDDVFLLQTVKRNYENRVLFSPNLKLIVRTKAKKTLYQFLNQRIRWASKASVYTDAHMQYSSYLVFFANLSLVLLIFASFLYSEAVYAFLIAFSLKLAIDFVFLYIITNYLKKKKLLKYFIPLAVFYPIYIIFTAFASQFQNFNWKGRTYRK